MGDRVWGRGQPPEPVVTTRVAEEMGAAGHSLVRVLHVVEAVLVGFPYFNSRIWDGVAGGVLHTSFDPAWLAGSGAGDVPTVLDFRCVLDEEGAKDCGL